LDASTRFEEIRAQEKLNLILSRPRVVNEYAKSRKIAQD